MIEMSQSFRYYHEHLEEQRKKKREYARRKRREDPKWAEREREKERNYNRKVRLDCLIHYGGNPPKCACCGEVHIEFLQIDHIKGNGKRHREEVGTGTSFYRWLRRMKYPDGFRVLCADCNYSLGQYGYCPHTKS